MLSEVLVVNKSIDPDEYVSFVRNLLPACKGAMVTVKDDRCRQFLTRGITMAEHLLDLASNLAKSSRDDPLSYHIATAGHALVCNLEIYQKGAELVSFQNLMAEEPLALVKVRETLTKIQERVEKLEGQVQSTVRGAQNLPNLKSHVLLLTQEMNEWEPIATNSIEMARLRSKAESMSILNS